MRSGIVLVGGLLLGFILTGARCSPEKVVPASPPSTASGVIDWDRARNAPVSDLVAQAFIPAGDALVEVGRPGPPLPMTEESGPPVQLSFATRARPEGNFGLCKATVVVVVINQEGREVREPIKTHDAFKVVGGTGSDAAPSWSDAYEARLEKLCKRAGRVLQSYDAPGAESFFTASIQNPNDLQYATHALQMAIAVAGRHPERIACGPYQAAEICEAPAALVARLNMRRLSSVEMAPCPTRLEWQCVTGKFDRSLVLRLEAQLGSVNGHFDVQTLEEIKLSREILLI